jgi:hypothetical protein
MVSEAAKTFGKSQIASNGNYDFEDNAVAINGAW